MKWERERGRIWSGNKCLHTHKRDYWFPDKTVYFMWNFRNNQKITPHSISTEENENCQCNKCCNFVQICFTFLCAIMQRIRSFIFRPQKAVELHPISTHFILTKRTVNEKTASNACWIEWNALFISQFYAIISSSLKLDAIILLPF